MLTLFIPRVLHLRNKIYFVNIKFGNSAHQHSTTKHFADVCFKIIMGGRITFLLIRVNARLGCVGDYLSAQNGDCKCHVSGH